MATGTQMVLEAKKNKLNNSELTPKSWTQNQLRGGQFFHDKI
ncbi:Uncharacterised protein [Finegoldia magna]|uniref:Uncharacterized protein n=1 Tax=Finegoldia magna TaxID=1260 RepID=A0A6N3CRY0_FINMA